jgi:chromosome partitioning protein
MNVVTFTSLKGGVGKSSLSILTANLLGKAGKRVLVIDMDLNNSASFYYLNSDQVDQSKEKNIAAALFGGADTNLNDYIQLTDRWGVDIISSSLDLINLRSISERKLSQLIPTIEKDYDVVIIDTQPTYDNLVLNAYNASDMIITPVNPSQFDYNTAQFLANKLKLDTGKYDNWFLTFNGYDHRWEGAKSGIQQDYVTLFTDTFENFTPKSAWYPWTTAIRKYIDRGLFLSDKIKDSDHLQNEQLFNAVYELASCFVDDNHLPRPEDC